MAVFREDQHQSLNFERNDDYILPDHYAYLGIQTITNNKVPLYMEQDMVTPLEHDSKMFKFHGHSNSKVARKALKLLRTHRYVEIEGREICPRKISPCGYYKYKHYIVYKMGDENTPDIDLKIVGSMIPQEIIVIRNAWHPKGESSRMRPRKSYLPHKMESNYTWKNAPDMPEGSIWTNCLNCHQVTIQSPKDAKEFTCPLCINITTL